MQRTSRNRLILLVLACFILALVASAFSATGQEAPKSPVANQPVVVNAVPTAQPIYQMSGAEVDKGFPDPYRWGLIGSVLLGVLGFIGWMIKDDRKRNDQQIKQLIEAIKTVGDGLAEFTAETNARLQLISGACERIEQRVSNLESKVNASYYSNGQSPPNNP